MTDPFQWNPDDGPNVASRHLGKYPDHRDAEDHGGAVKWALLVLGVMAACAVVAVARLFA